MKQGCAPITRQSIRTLPSFGVSSRTGDGMDALSDYLAGQIRRAKEGNPAKEESAGDDTDATGKGDAVVMCLAMPMKINTIDGAYAQCETGGLSQDIRVDFNHGSETRRLHHGPRGVCHRKNVKKRKRLKISRFLRKSKMLYENWFKNPGDVDLILQKIREYSDKTGPIRLMEVCGTHTMSIARSGIKSILPENVQLLSGPGCPVCVTPANMIDMILALSRQSEILIASYGDLLRVPGSARGDSLLKRRAEGGNVESVYSPVDALRLAGEHPDKEVVFLGVGFETTAPGTAACILEAASRRLTNFSVLCLVETD